MLKIQESNQQLLGHSSMCITAVHQAVKFTSTLCDTVWYNLQCFFFCSVYTKHNQQCFFLLFSQTAYTAFCDASMVRQVCSEIFKEVQNQSLSQADRRATYTIFLNLLTKHLAGINTSSVSSSILLHVLLFLLLLPFEVAAVITVIGGGSFSSLSRIWGGHLVIHSPPALFFFCFFFFF